jgi:branched-chain amino acid transport system ATP-binding protein
MLEVAEVRAGYGRIEALRGVGLNVGEREIVTLIGANGAGKTTLLMTICGNPRAYAGRIAFEGEDITGLATWEIAARGIAHVPEGRRIFPRMTVMENLKLGAVTAPPDWESRGLARVFDLFPRLKERAGQRGGTLSGGEQQMLAVGRALMAKPRLLLLDEPSLGLAPVIARRIFEAIREINQADGLTVFLVEQNAHRALRVAHRGYVMVNGRIVLEGTGQELLANREVRAAYLDGAAGEAGRENRPESC